MTKAPKIDETEHVAPEFELQSFLPYRLAVLADAVSQSIAELYSERFALNRAEWRILAALGDEPNMTGKQLSAYTTLDKMQVSRAVNAMLDRSLLIRSENPADRRNMVLCLSDQGQELLSQVIPVVQEREKFLLEALTETEQTMFEVASRKIHEKAKQLLDH